MRKIVLLLGILSAFLLDSCVSAGNIRKMSPQEAEEVDFVGTVQDDWLSFQFLHITPSKKSLEMKAIQKLEARASAEGFYTGKYAIRNINVEGGISLGSGLLTYIPCYFILCNFQNVVASGDIVQFKKNNAKPVKETSIVVAKPGKMLNVAVVETEVDLQLGAAKEISKAEIREITTELRRQAVKYLPKERYNIMTSETIQAQGSAILKECSGENCVVTLGAKIGADYIVRGTIGKFQKLFTLSVEIYDTEDGNLVASSDAVRSEKIIDLIEKSSKACADMYKNFAK